MMVRERFTRRQGLAALIALASFALSGCDDPPPTPSNLPLTRQVGFAARLQPNAFAWRTFIIDAAGTATVQLTAVFPQSDAVVGLGFDRFVDGDCRPEQTLETASGTSPQISTPVLPGTYCVRVSDLGHFTADWTFSIIVTVPIG